MMMFPEVFMKASGFFVEKNACSVVKRGAVAMSTSKNMPVLRFTGLLDSSVHIDKI
jgi:hypothetical protein